MEKIAMNKEYDRINRIQVVLAEKNVPQKELAEKLGMTPITMSRICSNVNQPSLKKLKLIAQALDVDIRELLNPTKSI